MNANELKLKLDTLPDTAINYKVGYILYHGLCSKSFIEVNTIQISKRIPRVGNMKDNETYIILE